MSPSILITGATGFLGRSAARYFHSLGFSVYGCCRTNLCDLDPEFLSYFTQLKSCNSLSIDFLASYKTSFQYILHAFGISSVLNSFTKPDESFSSTVLSLYSILEFVRLYNCDAIVLYPSSAAVYGSCSDLPLSLNHTLNPVSPYGFHKSIAESLLRQYADLYNIRTICVRFFSIYGIGLQKQLLWDVCNKCLAYQQLQFYGEGIETRDWINIADVLNLIFHLFQSPVLSASPFLLINGATGIRTSNAELISLVTQRFDPIPSFSFTGDSRPGDPKYYWADITSLQQIGWSPSVDLHSAIAGYVEWFKEYSESS